LTSRVEANSACRSARFSAAVSHRPGTSQANPTAPSQHDDIPEPPHPEHGNDGAA